MCVGKKRQTFVFFSQLVPQVKFQPKNRKTENKPPQIFFIFEDDDDSSSPTDQLFTYHCHP